MDLQILEPYLSSPSLIALACTCKSFNQQLTRIALGKLSPPIKIWCYLRTWTIEIGSLGREMPLEDGGILRYKEKGISVPAFNFKPYTTFVVCTKLVNKQVLLNGKPMDKVAKLYRGDRLKVANLKEIRLR